MKIMDRTLITAIFILAPAFAFGAPFQKIIQSAFPGFVILTDNDFEPYVLHASTSPSIVEGRFRGRTPDFAALIRSKESKLYRNTSEMGFDMKAVVCSEKKPYSCQALMEFDIPGRYQARITRSPSNKENLCGPETGKPGMPPDLITIVNDDKAMSIQFLFRDGKFSTCSEEDE